MWKAVLKTRINPIVQAYSDRPGYGISGIKLALEALGRAGGLVRPPGTQLAREDRENCRVGAQVLRTRKPEVEMNELPAVGPQFRFSPSRRIFLGALLSPCAHALAPDTGRFPHLAKVESTERLTRDTKRVRFRVRDGDPFRFMAGQFVLLEVAEEFLREWNERYKTAHTQIARPYSFASSPRQLPYFDLIVKLVGPPSGQDVPPGVASTYIHRLERGDSVRFSEPMGEMSASADSGRPLIMAAGGTGAAPFLSFFQSWFEDDRPHKRRIFFFFGVRSRWDLFLHSQFQRWAESRKDFTYVPVLSNPQETDGWRGETGFVSAVIDKRISATSDADAYVAGPPVMVREVKKVLASKGIREERIHHDPISVQ
jgi:NAD(P)H-flavin reductase